MVFKINLSTSKGKTFKLETDAPALKQYKLGDTINGEEISPDLTGYELFITGTSDFAGFTSMKGVEGIGLKKVLLGYGKAMHKRSKGDKKKPRPLTGGLRLRKTVRGTSISDAIVQINIQVVKEGSKSLNEIFPEQNKSEAPPTQEQAESVTESPQQKEVEAEIANPNKEPAGTTPEKEVEQS